MIHSACNENCDRDSTKIRILEVNFAQHMLFGFPGGDLTPSENDTRLEALPLDLTGGPIPHHMGELKTRDWKTRD